MRILDKVEHFYAVSEDAEDLYRLFSDELKLPVVWPYQPCVGFASGGVSFGNVVFEVVRFPDYEGDAEFRGIAFLPRQDAASTGVAFESLGISQSEPQPYRASTDGEEQVLWENIIFSDIAPRNATVFACDYKNRERVREGRAAAASQLRAENGGPLGVRELREIVVTVKDPAKAARDWARLLQLPENSKSTNFSVDDGPSIRLINGELEGISEAIVAVYSLANASDWLRENMLLDKSSSEIRIDITATQGLAIRLVE